MSKTNPAGSRDTERARIDATALAINTDAWTAPLVAFPNSLLRVSVQLNVGSVVNVTESLNGVMITHGLNGGTALTAGDDGTGQYDLVTIAGASYNLQCETAQTANAWRAVMRLIPE